MRVVAGSDILSTQSGNIAIVFDVMLYVLSALCWWIGTRDHYV